MNLERQHVHPPMNVFALGLRSRARVGLEMRLPMKCGPLPTPPHLPGSNATSSKRSVAAVCVVGSGCVVDAVEVWAVGLPTSPLRLGCWRKSGTLWAQGSIPASSPVSAGLRRPLAPGRNRNCSANGQRPRTARAGGSGTPESDPCAQQRCRCR